jgi:iron complex transport system permease protein
MRKPFALILMFIGVLSLMLVSVCAGETWIAPANLFGNTTEGWIIRELRAPRAVLAVSIGAVLGLSGAVLQGVTRNPLADSGVLGISACAALGAVLAIFMNVHVLHELAVPVAAIVGAALGLALLALLMSRAASMISFLLGGVMLASLSGAATALIISLAPTPFATSEIVTWLMGALTDRSWQDVAFALPFMVAGTVLLFFTGPALDALSLGIPTARTLGISLQRTNLLILAGVAMAVGAAVSVCGIIGFVGLVVPHVVRQLVGETPSRLLAPSALGGSLLVLLADTFVRIVPTASEIKLGILLSLIGAPAFLYILYKQRRDWI